jgi:hypothetical protein
LLKTDKEANMEVTGNLYKSAPRHKKATLFSTSAIKQYSSNPKPVSKRARLKRRRKTDEAILGFFLAVTFLAWGTYFLMKFL